MTLDLFQDTTPSITQERLGAGTLVLRNFASAEEHSLLAELESVIAAAPFRHMITPGGFEMSVAMTNCGHLGWVSDRHGYRYDSTDPLTGNPWPKMPETFLTLASTAAAEAGFSNFIPDACLVNRYRPRTRLTLHQDKNERDFRQPIVSVSLGVPAIFLFGGLKRSDKTQRIPLAHGDVVVWGGPDRLRYHGILAIKDNLHPQLGNERINLTFRKAG